MEYRKPSKKVIIDAVLQVLKDRGTIDTQTKMHKKVLAKLKEDDETYRLSAERMRIVAILSKKIKIGIRTRSVGAAPEADERDFKKQGLGYDPVVKRWRRIRPGEDQSGHYHHRENLHRLANHVLFVPHHSKKFTMRHSMVGKLLLDSNVTCVDI